MKRLPTRNSVSRSTKQKTQQRIQDLNSQMRSSSRRRPSSSSISESSQFSQTCTGRGRAASGRSGRIGRGRGRGRSSGRGRGSPVTSRRKNELSFPKGLIQEEIVMVQNNIGSTSEKNVSSFVPQIGLQSSPSSRTMGTQLKDSANKAETEEEYNSFPKVRESQSRNSDPNSINCESKLGHLQEPDLGTDKSRKENEQIISINHSKLYADSKDRIKHVSEGMETPTSNRYPSRRTNRSETKARPLHYETPSPSHQTSSINEHSFINAISSEGFNFKVRIKFDEQDALKSSPTKCLNTSSSSRKQNIGTRRRSSSVENSTASPGKVKSNMESVDLSPSGRSKGYRGRGGRGGRGRGRLGVSTGREGRGRHLSVSRRLSSRSSVSRGNMGTPHVLGDDGNLYYCKICGDVGDVVCCDGCPNVYHPTCITLGCDSRKSLDADDDPWFCPSCWEKRETNGSNLSLENTSKKLLPDFNSRQGSILDNDSTINNDGQRIVRPREKQSCVECNESSGGIMGQCKRCSISIHMPSCHSPKIGDQSIFGHQLLNEKIETGSDIDRILCTNCITKGMEPAKNQDEIKDFHSLPSSLLKNSKMINPLGHKETMKIKNHKSNTNSSQTPESSNTRGIPEDMSEDYDDSNLKEKGMSSSKKSIFCFKESGQVIKKVCDDVENGSTSHFNGSKISKTETRRNNLFSESNDSSSGAWPIRSTPPFFFFLAENRNKIERHLCKKNRSFKRSLKGFERNLYLAREGALWWKKLTLVEKKAYMDMSMQDFEFKVIEWKEDECIKAMLETEAENEVSDRDEKGDNDIEESATMNIKGNSTNDDLTDDVYWEKRLENLHSSTSIESSRATVNQMHENNNIVLNLLKDSRFHPTPMIHPSRQASYIDEGNFLKMTVPHFNVQGPVQTGIGDGCSGCLRGWNHFCPILKRHLPAVEYRSKLQPPLSSLVATRIGIDTANEVSTKIDTGPSIENSFVDSTKKSGEKLECNGSKMSTLENPCDRVDNIVQFIEKAVAIKRKESKLDCELLGIDADSKVSLLTAISDGEKLSKKRKIDENCGESDNNIFECGKCKKLIKSHRGCISCQRSELLRHISKQQPIFPRSYSSKKEYVSNKKSTTLEADLSKVQTIMLGRLRDTFDNFDNQSEGERKVARAMINKPWSPNVIFPLSQKAIPRKSSSQSKSSCAYIDNDAYSSDELDESLNADDQTKNNLILKTYFQPLETTNTSNNILQVRSSQREMMRSLPEANPSQLKATLRTDPGKFLMDKYEKFLNHEISKNDNCELDNLKQKENDFHKRCFSIAIHGIFLGIMRHYSSHLLQKTFYENKNLSFNTPLDLSTIRKEVLNNSYNYLDEIISDYRQLCKNIIFRHPQDSIYIESYEDLVRPLELLKTRANKWLRVLKSHTSSCFERWIHDDEIKHIFPIGDSVEISKEASKKRVRSIDFYEKLWKELRISCPEELNVVQTGEWLRSKVKSDFIRTLDNEGAYFGILAIQRSARAAQASQEDSLFRPLLRRNHNQDSKLRAHIDSQVLCAADPSQCHYFPCWKEEDLLQLLKRIQKFRLDNYILSGSGCTRCDGYRALDKARVVVVKDRIFDKGLLEEMNRSASDSRKALRSGLASKRTRGKTNKHVSIRGSPIHGIGLFADHSFKKGDVVAEFVGEYISNTVGLTRNFFYKKHHIKSYEFRVNSNLIIDATRRGGIARYINHCCKGNCVPTIIDGEPPNIHLKRVIFVSLCDINMHEEITFDYQLPVELDLNKRLPCKCGTELCRGFMDWNEPEVR